jgi:tripartite-type tricarboxylate transporter receptor subunit TctC
MPRAVVERVNEASARILREPELRARLETEGAEAAPGTPESFGQFIAAESERWGALIRKTGVTAD